MALLLVLLVVVPIIELYVFIQVSNAIGFLNALGIVILISIFGCWLVKRAGTKVWARFNEQLVAQRTPSKEVADGVCLLIAGALLIVPGFVTDAIGLLLLLPPIRSVASKALVRRYTGRAGVPGDHRHLRLRRRHDHRHGHGRATAADQPAGRAARP